MRYNNRYFTQSDDFISITYFCRFIKQLKSYLIDRSEMFQSLNYNQSGEVKAFTINMQIKVTEWFWHVKLLGIVHFPD